MADKVLLFDGLRLTNSQIDLLRTSRYGVLLDTYLRNGNRRRSYECLIHHGLLFVSSESDVHLQITAKGRKALASVTYDSCLTEILVVLRDMQPCERRLLHVAVGERIKSKSSCPTSPAWLIEQARRLGVTKEAASKVEKFIVPYMEAYKL